MKAILPRLAVLIGLILLIIAVTNIPLLTLSLGHVSISLSVKRNLTIILLWISYTEESKYLRYNITHVDFNIIIDSYTLHLITLPFKPGKYFSLNKTVSVNVTKEGIPLRLFLIDNVSKVKYPIAIVSSYREAYIPFTTYLYEGLLMTSLICYNAKIHVDTTEPLMLKVVLRGDTNKTKSFGPLMNKATIMINETFGGIVLRSYIIKGPFLLRLSGDSAKLYPEDNLAIFLTLSLLLILTPLITWIIKKVLRVRK